MMQCPVFHTHRPLVAVQLACNLMLGHGGGGGAGGGGGGGRGGRGADAGRVHARSLAAVHAAKCKPPSVLETAQVCPMGSRMAPALPAVFQCQSCAQPPAESFVLRTHQFVYTAMAPAPPSKHMLWLLSPVRLDLISPTALSRHTCAGEPSQGSVRTGHTSVTGGRGGSRLPSGRHAALALAVRQCFFPATRVVISPVARIGAGGALLLVTSLLAAESMDAAGQSSTATASRSAIDAGTASMAATIIRTGGHI